MDGFMNILSTAAQQGDEDKICKLISGGFDKIEELQSHENEQVREKARSIMTNLLSGAN